MRLHLVRHGETRHNAEQRIQGDLIDDDLNDVGRAQAEALWRHYARQRMRGLVVSAIYTSPLQRARQTAGRIAEALDLPEPVVLRGVRELNWGHHMGKLNTGPTLADMTRVLTAWQRGDLGASVLGGETPGAAWKRAMEDIAPLFERHERDDVVLVAHGRLNKILMSGLLHGHLNHMEHYPQANAGVSVLEGPLPWRLIASNDTRHLEGLRTLDERA